MSESLRQRLRSATAGHHARVDAAFGRFDLSRPDDYRAFLVAHARALWPLECGLEAAGVARLLPDWPERRRRPALARDLAWLGAAVPDEARIQPLPLADEAACWGALYTLEGSRLGGAVLARQVATQPALAGALAYLGHGAGGMLWPAFLARLEAAAPMLAWPALEAGACAAFELFADAARAGSAMPPERAIAAG
ncbi:biliverdin-producing heme oxygenase [Chitiniphilus shinanonensis]|uniref:biliverdin-producing heme oxygenase n=1 Tax=Chitiniphilus shinanonensis TaxID=553088 RepID=UPI00035D437F|nr:biliverdin-producing heme oxygenase [Chitiniphilus shinanonensis]